MEELWRPQLPCSGGGRLEIADKGDFGCEALVGGPSVGVGGGLGRVDSGPHRSRVVAEMGWRWMKRTTARTSASVIESFTEEEDLLFRRCPSCRRLFFLYSYERIILLLVL